MSQKTVKFLSATTFDFRNFTVIFLAVTVLAYACAFMPSAFAKPQSNAVPALKKLIWFGGMDPTKLTVDNLKAAGRTFDGFVVQHVRGSHDNEPYDGSNFAWCAFSNRRYTLDSNDKTGDYIGDSLSALERLPKSIMPDRFLGINAAPYDLSSFDWTDDRFWANVASNLRVGSELASKAKLKGFFLDTEMYNSGNYPLIFSYQSLHAQSRYKHMSFRDLSAIAERRGRQVIDALNAHMPVCKVFVTFGYIVASLRPRSELDRSEYSLLIPFLDGMLDASTPSTTFIDGFESSYWHPDTPNYFANCARAIRGGPPSVAKFQRYPNRFLKQYRVAFGLFLDRDAVHYDRHNVYGWCGDGKPIYYSPRRLAYTVQQACKASDEYVWFYSDRPNPWIKPSTGGNDQFPTIVSHAIRDGRRHAVDQLLAPLPPSSASATEAEICTGR